MAMKTGDLLLLTIVSLFTTPGSAQVAGTKLWDVATPQTVISSPAIGPDGRIYVGTGERIYDPADAGSLCSFSPEGKTNWILNFSRAVRSSPSIGPDGRIYAGTFDGQVIIADSSGSYSKVETGGYIAASPAIGSDGTVYIASISNLFNKLFALTPDGGVKWVFDMTPLILTQPYQIATEQSSSPAIGPDGTIYIGSMDMNLYAVNPDGTTNWVFPLDSETYASPAIGADGTVYLGTSGGMVFAIDPKGMAKWKAQVSSSFIETSAALSRDGTIYVGAGSGQVYALNPNGTPRWSYTITGGGCSASPALASDGSIYVASWGLGALYGLHPSGTNLWIFTAYPMGTSIFCSAAIGQDGTIYFGAGKRLFAVYATNSLMQSAWPMFRGNASHTARSIQRGLGIPRVHADGNISFDVKVEAGRTYQIESSTNQLNWTGLTNFVSETVTNHVIDLTATNSLERFYRLSTECE
jgi:outer membrane protein assembly factor BamB